MNGSILTASIFANCLGNLTLLQCKMEILLASIFANCLGNSAYCNVKLKYLIRINVLLNVFDIKTDLQTTELLSRHCMVFILHL